MKRPEIRFEGFTDDWEQRKLGELSQRVIVGLATSVTPYYRDEGIPILRNLNIKENYLDDSDILYLDEDYANSQTGKQIHTEDVLTVHTGYIGTSCVVPEKYNNCLTFTTLVTTTNREKLLGSFLSQYLNSEVGMNAVQMVTTQGGRQNLNTNDFVKVEIPYPTVKEQQRICEFLGSLDNLITLHQRKHKKLLSVKKSMLEKMFPQNGAKVPEIRFEGFTDDWEQRKFSELYEKSSEKNDGSIDVERNITVATMQFKPDVTVSSEDYLKTYYTFNVGDIAFEGHHSKDFMFGRFVENDIGDGIVSHIFAVFRPIVDYDLYYWKYAIHNESIMRPILSKSTKASTMMHDLVTKDFLNESILVPSVDEQKRIGAYLNNLDFLITLHQRKLESLKHLKSALLDKMFA